MLVCTRPDPRERVGLVCCTIAVSHLFLSCRLFFWNIWCACAYHFCASWNEAANFRRFYLWWLFCMLDSLPILLSSGMQKCCTWNTCFLCSSRLCFEWSQQCEITSISMLCWKVCVSFGFCHSNVAICDSLPILQKWKQSSLPFKVTIGLVWASHVEESCTCENVKL